jgi:hypothetical protein
VFDGPVDRFSLNILLAGDAESIGTYLTNVRGRSPWDEPDCRRPARP